MINYIELGGEKRPILFGTLAFRWLKQEAGLTPADIQKSLSEDQDFDVLIQLATYALRAGQMAVGEKVTPHDADTVALWVDTSANMMQTVKKISDLVADAMGLQVEVPEAETDGAKKKKVAA